MQEAVIVATARTPIGRAFKGSLIEARPDDMGAFVVNDVMEKAPAVNRAMSSDCLSDHPRVNGRASFPPTMTQLIRSEQSRFNAVDELLELTETGSRPSTGDPRGPRVGRWTLERVRRGGSS